MNLPMKNPQSLQQNLQFLVLFASPQSAPSGSIESNPLVLLVRSGAVSLKDALTLGLAGVENFSHLLETWMFLQMYSRQH